MRGPVAAGGYGGGVGMNYGSVDPNRRIEQNNLDDPNEDSRDHYIENLEINARHGFVRKVFLLTGCQLLITAAIAAPFVLYQLQARQFIQNNMALVVFATFLPCAMLCYSFCDPTVTRVYPKNYIFLFVFTLAFGLICGIACARFTTWTVLGVAGMTAVIVLGLMLFACQTTYDFTGAGPYLFAGVMCLSLMGLFFMFLPASRIVEVVYSGLAALLFSFYLVYDVQMIVGGKHRRFQFSMDDYCFAALTLYMDIIQLFLHLLHLFGQRN
ncbi:unnamed protein product [Amoebophrya sp. A120]|nr:unnamed protein product [Amoebophrya sp. A120]|eukprot:GSA120T00014571001.1